MEDKGRSGKRGTGADGRDVCSSASGVHQDGSAAVYCRRNESKRERKEEKGKKREKKQKSALDEMILEKNGKKS